MDPEPGSISRIIEKIKAFWASLRERPEQKEIEDAERIKQNAMMHMWD